MERRSGKNKTAADPEIPGKMQLFVQATRNNISSSRGCRSRYNGPAHTWTKVVLPRWDAGKLRMYIITSLRRSQVRRHQAKERRKGPCSRETAPKRNN